MINARLADCDALLAVIGPNWADARNEDGTRRLDNPDDFVRLEREAALKCATFASSQYWSTGRICQRSIFCLKG